MRYDIQKYERVRGMRIDRDLTQEEIGKILHVVGSTYTQYELGERAFPVEAFEKLADFYGTSVDYLLGRTDVKEPYPPAKRRKDRG